MPLRSVLIFVLFCVGAARAYEDSPIEETPISEDDRQHWSFQPLTRITPPTVSGATWPENEIDAFILARLEAHNLAPQPRADRATIIRRLSFDLCGLPPAPTEVEEFVNDKSPTAYERLVDRLLASPHYGERWAQHWLDLASFAETDGFEHDKVREIAWEYRDWVIDALNADMPYDRFVSLQIAADELGEHSIATAFCLSGPDMPDINSQEERRHNVLNDLTSTVGAVLLGLQFRCAQCHDHKHDPISQADFYRLRAIFDPAVSVKRNKSLNVLQENEGATPASHIMIRGDWRRPGPAAPPDFPRIAKSPNTVFTPTRVEKSSGRRTALAVWLTQSGHPLTARVIANRVWQHHFGEGLSRTPSDFGTAGDEPSHPKLLDWLATELVRRDWSLKQLHRLIVTSATYRQASRPIDRSRRADAGETARDALVRWNSSHQRDPDNRLLSRFARRRLCGEALRDAMLAASGALNRTAGGPGVRPPLSEGLARTLLGNHWEVSPNKADHYRRSIYVFARRNLRYPIFDAFDRPDANASCPRRNRSTTAPQSLLLLNSEFSLEAARRLAGAALSEHEGVTDDVIVDVVQRCLGREPGENQRRALRRFIDDQANLLRDESRPNETLALPLPWSNNVDPVEAAALTDLCLALFNSNEFVYLE